MNTQANGKTILQNLWLIIEKMDERQAEGFEHWSKRRKRQDPAYLKIFNKIWKAISEGQTADEVNRKDFQESLKTEGISAKPHNAFNNLYDNLLLFLGQAYSHEDYQKWQKIAEDGVNAVESLIKMGLQSLAATHLLKIEKQLRKKSNFNGRSYHYNPTPIARLMHLKVKLAGKSEIKLDPTEEDRLMTNLTDWGYNLIGNFRFKQKDIKSFNKDRFEGLAIWFRHNLEREEWEQACDAANQLKAEWQKPDDRGFAMHQHFELMEEYLDFQSTYLQFKQYLLGIQGGSQPHQPPSIPKTGYSEPNRPSNLAKSMVLYQLAEDLRISLGFCDSKNSHWQQLPRPDGPPLFVDDMITEFPIRYEFNLAYWDLVQGQTEFALERLLTLKKKKEVKGSDRLLLVLLIMEAISHFRMKAFDPAKATLNKVHTKLKADFWKDKEFEKKAYRMMADILRYNWSRPNEIGGYNKDNIKELGKLADSTNPLHELVLSTLKGEFPYTEKKPNQEIF